MKCDMFKLFICLFIFVLGEHFVRVLKSEQRLFIFGEKGPVLEIPNFSLTERLFIFGEKGLWIFYRKIMEIACPPSTKVFKFYGSPY